ARYRPGRSYTVGARNAALTDQMLDNGDARWVVSGGPKSRNTRERQWYDRSQLTVAATLLGCVTASERPTSLKNSFDEKLDSSAVAHFDRLVGSDPRPLDARADDDPEWLHYDLHHLGDPKLKPPGPRPAAWWDRLEAGDENWKAG
ncbi:MAG: hypothetical protein AAFQ82_14550, partial [Myxococcota bacterium]